MFRTYEEASQALNEAELDVAADMGEEAVEAGYGDLVHDVASRSTPEVAAELIRRKL